MSGAPLTLAALYRRVRTELTQADIESAGLEARLLVEHFTDSKPEDIVCRPMTAVMPDVVMAVDAAIARRLAGEPVYRILGQREFYGLTLKLSKETLEPRPDTETLIEAVLPFVKDRVAQTGQCRILDLGTGTGAIALALLSQVPEAQATGVDISADALATAQANAEANGLAGRFAAVRSDWFEAVEGQFDLIVSNPPYIPSRDIDGLSREVREHDPMAALDGGPDGLDAYRQIAESAAKHLVSDGLLSLEIGYDQQLSVSAVFEGEGWRVVGYFQDLGGNNRVISLQIA